MSGLRIGWATPWNEHSAIASVADDVARELVARGHAVTVLRTEVDEAAAMPPRAFAGEVLHLDALDDDALRARFDVVVAQIGNYVAYHDATVRRLARVGMVGVFHDLFLAHLAAGHFERSGNPHGVSEAARAVYGPEGLRDGEHFWADFDEMLRRRPMLEWLARHCVGAVAHAGHYAERLRQACPGPVATIPLAFTAPGMPPLPAIWDRLTVAAIGHANPNKRIDQVIMAIGSSAILRGRCRLRVIGDAQESETARLRALAATLGMEPPSFTGWVSDADLRWQLRDVDAIACLRNPVLEGASGSLVLGLLSERPVLVTDHGCYAEVPADAVLGCRPEAEALDAMRHLEWLLAHPAEGAALGQRARAFAEARHSPAAYVDALVPLLERVVVERPRREARRHLFSTLGSLGLGVGDPAALRAEAVLKELRQ